MTWRCGPYSHYAGGETPRCEACGSLRGFPCGKPEKLYGLTLFDQLAPIIPAFMVLVGIGVFLACVAILG